MRRLRAPLMCAAVVCAWGALALSPVRRHRDPRPSEHVAVLAPTFTNPVWARDFPDPHVIRAGGRFYAYATHGSGFDFQVMESADLVHWTHRGSAFRPPWSNEHLWAPEVIRYRGKYYMTYSAMNTQTRKHDIGIADAKSPLGPFAHRAVLVRAGSNRVGVIDTNVFVDTDGTPYLLYSEEEPRRIVMRKMTSDLMKVSEEVTELVRPDRPHERGVTEAPTLIKRGGLYHLFFSVGWFQSNKRDACYAVYHAVARSVKGPYAKTPEPVLQGVPGKVYGPGHQSIITLPSGEMWMAYHGWDDQNEPRYGSNPLGRTLRIDRVVWNGGRPVVPEATTTPQPAPRMKR